MTLDFSILSRFAPALAKGLLTTLELTLICGTLGIALGFLLGLGRRAQFWPIRLCATVYVELFRGTPVLIQLFWIFFCLPLILGIELTNFVSAVIALTLCMAAISSESFRASLAAIGKDQIDACIALGLPRRVQITAVILPQAVLRAVPMLLSNTVSLFKESALVSAVGMTDLMFIAQNISNNTARPVEVLTVIAAIYFTIAFPLTRAVTRIEKRILQKLAV